MWLFFSVTCIAMVLGMVRMGVALRRHEQRMDALLGKVVGAVSAAVDDRLDAAQERRDMHDRLIDLRAELEGGRRPRHLRRNLPGGLPATVALGTAMSLVVGLVVFQALDGPNDDGLNGHALESDTGAEADAAPVSEPGGTRPDDASDVAPAREGAVDSTAGTRPDGPPETRRAAGAPGDSTTDPTTPPEAPLVPVETPELPDVEIPATTTPTTLEPPLEPDAPSGCVAGEGEGDVGIVACVLAGSLVESLLELLDPGFEVSEFGMDVGATLEVGGEHQVELSLLIPALHDVRGRVRAGLVEGHDDLRRKADCPARFQQRS